MKYEIALPPTMAADLRRHLLHDRSREQMAITLCGVARNKNRVRLLGRHLIALPREAFAHQSAGGLELSREVQQHILKLAAAEGLSQIDWHTHPGDGPSVNFSSIDDRNEAKLTAYLHEHIPDTFYGSVVLNAHAMAARMWLIRNGHAASEPIVPPDLRNFLCSLPDRVGGSTVDLGRFDRQVLAFGPELQRRLGQCKVGIVGLGGLGSLLADQLARLGIRDFVLIDPDTVEHSNLNRLLGATAEDAEEERSKVEVAANNIRRIDRHSEVKMLRCSVFAPRSLKALRDCDLLVAATDNDGSRLALNALACQYLIPIVHAGVNLGVQSEGSFEDISGEVAIPPLGSWCLLCSGIISAERATWDLARPEERTVLQQRGYLADTPAPAVYHLNGVIASLAATEIHNLIWSYKPLCRYVVYRELATELMSIQVPQTEGCLHCAPTGLLGLGDLAPLWTPQRKRSALPSALVPNQVDFSEEVTAIES